MRKPTIGTNPLDAVIPSSAKQDSPKTITPIGTKDSKERLTVHLPISVIDRAKNAVYWTPGLTLADLAEQAFTGLLDRLEKERGSAFPQRSGELKGGRPLK